MFVERNVLPNDMKYRSEFISPICFPESRLVNSREGVAKNDRFFVALYSKESPNSVANSECKRPIIAVVFGWGRKGFLIFP